MTAGLNLYITVLILGLMNRYELLSLPANLDVLSSWWVLGTAGFLLAVEFLADKIPYVDNTWDAIHSFIRVPAGAVLAASALGEVPPSTYWVAALLGGAVTFTAHGAKATTRLAVNSTPEPFSNWFLSFAEDAISLGLLWLVASYPYLALGASILLLLLFAMIIYFFYRFFKMIFSRDRLRPAT